MFISTAPLDLPAPSPNHWLPAPAQCGACEMQDQHQAHFHVSLPRHALAPGGWMRGQAQWTKDQRMFWNRRVCQTTDFWSDKCCALNIWKEKQKAGWLRHRTKDSSDFQRAGICEVQSRKKSLHIRNGRKISEVFWRFLELPHLNLLLKKILNIGNTHHVPSVAALASSYKM